MILLKYLQERIDLYNYVRIADGHKVFLQYDEYDGSLYPTTIYDANCAPYVPADKQFLYLMKINTVQFGKYNSKITTEYLVTDYKTCEYFGVMLVNLNRSITKIYRDSRISVNVYVNDGLRLNTNSAIMVNYHYDIIKDSYLTDIYRTVIPIKTKSQILMIKTLQKMNDDSNIVRLLPNEILFIIFDHLINDITISSTLY